MSRPSLLLLHGAIGASDQLQALAEILTDDFNVYTLDFSGHGKHSDHNGEFSIENFAQDVLDFIDKNNPGNLHIFGYSMGGYVALYLAKNHPEKVNKIMTLGTKFHWDVTTASQEIKHLQPEIIEQKVPAFANTLAQRHGDACWKTVLQKTAAMMIRMGEKNPLSVNDYKPIVHEVLIMIGDHDKMVSLEETVAVFRAIVNSKLLVIPDTPHPIEKVNLQRLKNEILAFTAHKSV